MGNKPMTEATRRNARRTSAEDEFYSELDAPARQFLTPDEKDTMAAKAIPFYVTNVELSEDRKYGARWELEIVGADGLLFNYANQRVILTMSQHGARDHIMRKLQSVAMSKKVGPLVLEITDIDNGQTWQSIKRAPESEK